MKTKLYSAKLFLSVLLFLFITGCKKEDSPPPTLPVLNTTAASNITEITATGGGNITSDGGAPITARGVCWSTNQTPTVSNSFTTDGTGTGSYSSSLTGLQFATTYNVRAYATNSAGTAYGSQVSFSTISTVTDIDGNVYQTVKVGTQIWMTGNLKVTKYRNGDPIVNITDNTQWSNLATGAYCNYNNVSSNASTYGNLYNWYSMKDSRNIAPTGWHVPTLAEWTTLTDNLGGSSLAGGKLKETGILHWNSPNTGATNESGFLALPGGCRWGTNGTFDRINLYGHWWTASENDATTAWLCVLSSSNTIATLGFGTKVTGYSVRCIKN